MLAHGLDACARISQTPIRTSSLMRILSSLMFIEVTCLLNVEYWTPGRGAQRLHFPQQRGVPEAEKRGTDQIPGPGIVIMIRHRAIVPALKKHFLHSEDFWKRMLALKAFFEHCVMTEVLPWLRMQVQRSIKSAQLSSWDLNSYVYFRRLKYRLYVS